MADFTMPSLGADMDEGTLLEWRVAVGDPVTKGDIIAVVDTEKSTVEVEVFVTGVVEELLVDAGTEVPVGTPLARIRTVDIGLPAPAPTPPPTPVPTPEPEPGRAQPAPGREPEPMQPGPQHEPRHEPQHGTRHDTRLVSPIVRHLADELGVDAEHLEGTGVGHRITRDDVERQASRQRVPSAGGSSPLARRRAEELGVDIAGVAGTGPGGAVLERDVDAASHRSATSSAPTRAATPGPKSGAERQASVRQAIARLMTKANDEIPHYHLMATIDLHCAMEWLARRNAGRPPSERMLPAALLLRSTALAAARHPELNGSWIDDGFRPSDGVHLGVAISLRGGGLIAPAIRDADQRSLEDTMDALRDLVARSRQGSLRGSELSGASLTVTNLGERGAEAVFGVIHPPQVALVGFGRVVDRPWAIDGLVGVRPTVTSTLSADHRATDGHVGSRLLETIDALLQQPADL